MRTPSRRGSASLAMLVAGIVLVVAACGGSAPSAAPSARPRPVATPDPHLADPATLEEVWRGLGQAGLRMTANNATAGTAGSALVKRINATYLGWPLMVSEYRSSKLLAEETPWEAGAKPSQGEAPVAIVGANILITWGPQTGEEPATPDARQVDGLDELVLALDRLLNPLRIRSSVDIAMPGVVLGADAGASPSATSEAGEATPAP
ncbi:MAG TPA: hypothetical protein VF119_04790 [Candidatus Limnocylindrales bacterium]